jgi:hypothetical protein
VAAIYRVTGFIDTSTDPPRVALNVEPTTDLPTRLPLRTTTADVVREPIPEPRDDYRPPRPQPAPPGALRRFDPDRRPIPQLKGRVEFEGEVLSVRYVDQGHGRVAKMTIRHAEGWEVIGTVPGALHDVKAGQRVRLTARLEPSDSDPARGTFRRPTQAEVVR